MKKILGVLIFFVTALLLNAQNEAKKNNPDNVETGYKKRVLESTEIDLLSSLYGQKGNNAAVTGGIGNEKLTDFATNINVSIPLNADDVLTIDGTVSAYSSASSSNLNPFYDASRPTYVSSFSGASRSGGRNNNPVPVPSTQGNTKPLIIGSPWVASSGASRSDVWTNANFGYSHTSDNRDNTYSGNLSVSNEFDYSSFGTGAGITKQFNQKNTEIGLKANVYLDKWRPQYPTEIKTYIETKGNLNADYFKNVDILDASGRAINKSSANAWKPFKNTLIENSNRNTFSLSLSFSQIISKNAQFSIFSDVILQRGWLSNPMQRVYFSDIDNFYIGSRTSINSYENPINTNVFQLADDIERLPSTRTKIPVGLRYHQYINERLVIRTYYRYYFDDWGVQSHTANLELPIKLSDHFTLYPNYRYYTQTAADYFAPFEQHQSTEEFYTSDYDLSAINANQYGIGLKYTDVFTKSHIGKLGLKNLSFNYNAYFRNNGLKAHIISVGAKFVLAK